MLAEMEPSHQWISVSHTRSNYSMYKQDYLLIQGRPPAIKCI